MSAVVPVLYRNVARLARLHDRDPALKALLLLVPTKEYDWRERRWRPLWKTAAQRLRHFALWHGRAPEQAQGGLHGKLSARASSGWPPAAASLGRRRPRPGCPGMPGFVCRTQVGGV